MALTASTAACSVLNEVQEIEQAALADVIAVRERVSQPCCPAVGHWFCTVAVPFSLTLQFANRWGWSTPAQSQDWPALCLQCLCTMQGMPAPVIGQCSPLGCNPCSACFVLALVA